MAEGRITQPIWFQTLFTQLRLHFRKVNIGMIKDCCDLYLMPDPTPKLKTKRYDIITQQFRARLSYLLSLSDINFTKEYIPLFPQKFLDPTLQCIQLVEFLLRGEFGEEISKTVMSLPCSEIAKERNKESCRKKHNLVVSDARKAREAHVQSWLQVISDNVVYGCLNTYHEGSQWIMPPICCVCSKQQHTVEMHDVVLNTNKELLGYFSTLRNEDESFFSDDEFQFADPCLNGLVLDPDGLQVNENCTTLHICHLCNGYLPR